MSLAHVNQLPLSRSKFTEGIHKAGNGYKGKGGKEEEGERAWKHGKEKGQGALWAPRFPLAVLFVLPE